ATTSASLAAGSAIKLRGTSANHWNLEVEVVHPAQVHGTGNHFWNLVSRAACPVSQSLRDETVNCLNKF
ncbi:MAG: hypothetical protein ACKPKO_45975, partial [Candidatus Fonsibacter sp.]